MAVLYSSPRPTLSGKPGRSSPQRALPFESMGGIDRQRLITSYSAKASWQLLASQRIDATFFGNPAKGDMGPQRLAALQRTDTAGFGDNAYGGHNQAVKYEGAIGSKSPIEASFSNAQNRIRETPSVDTWAVTDATVVPNVVSGGIGFYEVGNDGTNKQWSAKSTHLLGGHSIQYSDAYARGYQLRQYHRPHRSEFQTVQRR